MGRNAQRRDNLRNSVRDLLCYANWAYYTHEREKRVKEALRLRESLRKAKRSLTDLPRNNNDILVDARVLPVLIAYCMKVFSSDFFFKNKNNALSICLFRD